MKKFIISRLITVLIGLFSLVIIQACGQDSLNNDSIEGGNGRLTVFLSDNINSRTIEPSISMTIATYDITATCNGQTAVSFLDVPVSRDSVEFEDLVIGSWTITVTGLNANGIAIGSGRGTADLNLDPDLDLSVIILPLSGNGTLNLNASWDETSVGSGPVLSAALTPIGGSADTISFTIDISQGTAAYSNSAIAAGYYTLSLVLTDGGVNCGGATEIVRIASGQTSSGNISLAVSDHGVIVVTITQQMNDPIIIVLADTVSSITISGSMTVTASASNANGVTYYWYIDGVSTTGTASCTINGNLLSVGQHRLDVIAMTSDNTRAGSISHIFTVTRL